MPKSSDRRKFFFKVGRVLRTTNTMFLQPLDGW